jgi:hypothetical protein
MTHKLEKVMAKDVAAHSQSTGIEKFLFDLRRAPNIEEAALIWLLS